MNKINRTLEIKWAKNSDLYFAPTRVDCESAAWVYLYYGPNSRDHSKFLFWSYLELLMLHG